MTVEMLPVLAALLVLTAHGLYLGGLRSALHLRLDALPQDLRDMLDWPLLPTGFGQNAAYAERRSATVRLAYWPLPASPRIPADLYALERAYRRHHRIETGLLSVVILAFALAHPQAWMIALPLLLVMLGLLRVRRVFVDPWPDLEPYGDGAEGVTRDDGGQDRQQGAG
ncbi:MAG: hypothetical protein AAGC92_08860 [Pseudomonadota bacterium]